MYTWWCYIINIYALCLVLSDKKIFSIDSYSERLSSQAGPLHSPCALNWIKFVEAYLVRWCYIPNIKVLCIVVSDKMICFMFSQYKSKAEGKTQKSIQSSTSTDSRHNMGKWTLHTRESRDQQFPSRWSHAYVNMPPPGMCHLHHRAIICKNLVEVY